MRQNNNLFVAPVDDKLVANVIKSKISEFNQLPNVNVNNITSHVPYKVDNIVIAYIQKLQPKGFLALSANDEI